MTDIIERLEDLANGNAEYPRRVIIEAIAEIRRLRPINERLDRIETLIKRNGT